METAIIASKVAFWVCFASAFLGIALDIYSWQGGKEKRKQFYSNVVLIILALHVMALSAEYVLSEGGSLF